jgi:hypothetical protein
MDVVCAHEGTIRCFIGFAVEGPWPASTLRDPLLLSDRHLTILFLGQQPLTILLERCRRWHPQLWSAPLLIAESWLRLPKEDPHVLALSTPPCTQADTLTHLIDEGRALFDPAPPPEGEIGREEGRGQPPGRSWLPHVTVSRDPDQEANPLALPLWCADLHLYRSLPNRTYEPIWTWPIPRAFEEFDHPADRAFRCRGRTWPELALALLWALSQQVPELVQGAARCAQAASQADAVRILNQLLSEADARSPIPWKAVTFHGRVEQHKEGMVWEVVVDV